MTIEKKINHDAVTLVVSGRLDTQTAPELEKELDASLPGLKELIFESSESNEYTRLNEAYRCQ